jgi:hypothetical protein
LATFALPLKFDPVTSLATFTLPFKFDLVSVLLYYLFLPLVVSSFETAGHEIKDDLTVSILKTALLNLISFYLGYLFSSSADVRLGSTFVFPGHDWRTLSKNVLYYRFVIKMFYFQLLKMSSFINLLIKCFSHAFQKCPLLSICDQNV